MAGNYRRTIFEGNVECVEMKMRNQIRISKHALVAAFIALAIVISTGLLVSQRTHGQSTAANSARAAGAGTNASQQETSLDLSESQLSAIKIEPVGTYAFPEDNEAVGNIDFDGDLSVQVFPDYQGTIIETLVQLGAEVQKDQPLYTIKSPDLIQAESTLIAAAATFELTNKELVRAKDLVATNGVSVRELEQATSDQQTAEGALKAARDAVRVFGKTDAEIDQMIASRRIDPALVVRSPISGKVTAKNAQPGFLVQPGNLPAPYSVANVSLKWMLADVAESDEPLFHLGQPVKVEVMAYPHRQFKGRVSKIYESVDPNTHRVTVRSEISDPHNELRPGMLANFVIRVEKPVESTAIPTNGVVREGDGTMTAWVTTDRHRFTQRVVKTGLRTDGQVQILAGLQRGELVVSDGAVFLSNMLEAPPSD
jgi:membrane fusion protein, heavy metal efflux system